MKTPRFHPLVEVKISMTRYKRNLMSIIRRDEKIVHMITRCGKVELVHMPVNMYNDKLEELEIESKRRYG